MARYRPRVAIQTRPSIAAVVRNLLHCHDFMPLPATHSMLALMHRGSARQATFFPRSARSGDQGAAFGSPLAFGNCYSGELVDRVPVFVAGKIISGIKTAQTWRIIKTLGNSLKCSAKSLHLAFKLLNIAAHGIHSLTLLFDRLQKALALHLHSFGVATGRRNGPVQFLCFFEPLNRCLFCVPIASLEPSARAGVA
jgi:hypothetical protein